MAIDTTKNNKKKEEVPASPKGNSIPKEKDKKSPSWKSDDRSSSKSC